MKQKHLGGYGPAVSAIGLGCMRMSRSAAPLDLAKDAESIATIQAAVDHGISYLDTGDFYGMGHNEALVGQAIKDRRDKVFLSVKFGAMFSPSLQFLGHEGRPASVKNFATYSLQRLGVDVIDLYQPGRPDPGVPYEETIGAIADLIQEGKVRYLGVSEVGAENLRKAHSVHPVTALEIEYSLACRFAEHEILPTARTGRGGCELLAGPGDSVSARQIVRRAGDTGGREVVGVGQDQRGELPERYRVVP
jgi:aryl-alcohol dehydrogenase-like predicted oxidoreductase